ncbi:MAG: hypothetical protein K8T89_22980 [Planctomycetes bacterium]|nr:hypothetical protein [Planctomycetota bacterium]
MDTHPYGGGGSVVVDTCVCCELIWLDAGEIDVLARYRPRQIALATSDNMLTPRFDGSPCEPTSRSSGYDDANESDGSNGLWDILKRLF